MTLAEIHKEIQRMYVLVQTFDEAAQDYAFMGAARRGDRHGIEQDYLLTGNRLRVEIRNLLYKLVD